MLTITGPLRSGTSLVARIAHQLGIDMGQAMSMPPAGSGQRSWASPTTMKSGPSGGSEHE